MRLGQEGRGNEMLTLSYDEVADDLLVGSYPHTPEDVRHLAGELGVTGVLSLQDDRDLDSLGLRWDLLVRAYQAAGVVAERQPVRDFSPRHLTRELPACVAALHRLRSAGRRVYLHCTAGVNRSATVAIAYLHAHGGLTLEDAIAQVRERRDCYPYDDVLRRIPSMRFG